MMNKKWLKFITIIVLAAFGVSILLPLFLSFVRAEDYSGGFYGLESGNDLSSYYMQKSMMDSQQKLMDAIDKLTKSQEQQPSSTENAQKKTESIDSTESDSSTSLPLAPVATPKPLTLQDEVDQKRDEAAKIEQEKEALQRRIDEVNALVTNTETEIAGFDADIAALQADIEAVNAQIEVTNSNINEKELELEKAQQTRDDYYEAFKDRLRVMYEEGIISYIDMLFSSESLADLLDRYEIVMELAEYDKSMLNTLEEAVSAVDNARAALQRELETQEKALAKLNARIAVLEGLIEGRNNGIAKLNDYKKELVAAYEEIEAQEQSIQGDIKYLLDQIEAAKWEEVQRAAREANARLARFNETASPSSGSKSTVSIDTAEPDSGAINTTKPYTSDRFLWPLPSNYSISSTYGMRFHPILQRNSLHTGIDISASYGADVLAAADGEVIKAEYSSAYGNYLIIEHADTATLYAHGSKLLVDVGDQISAGDVIMQAGSTGYSTGPHLHFEILVSGDAVNPLIYFE